MEDEIHLNDLREAIEELSYPIERHTAAASFEDVTVLYADGDEPLGDLVARVPSSEFASAEELEAEILQSAPVEAIGEPGQSEGDA